MWTISGHIAEDENDFDHPTPVLGVFGSAHDRFQHLGQLAHPSYCLISSFVNDKDANCILPRGLCVLVKGVIMCIRCSGQ